ncbi:MAG: retropepsin-like aspartic protease [Candidatus Berkiella sp.]
MSSIKKLLIYLVVAMTPWSLPASSPIPSVHYEPTSKAIIPESIEMPEQVSIPATVGDVYLQSPIIRVKINGQGPFLFVFDTGFTESVISKTLAKKLNLPIVKSVSSRVQTPTQIVNVFENILLAKKIEIDNIVVNNFALFSSSSYEDDIDHFENLKVDGILGASIFYGKLITLDYKKEHIHIKNGELKNNEHDVISWVKPSIVPAIHGKIKFTKLKKEEKQNFILDTGDSTYIYVSTCDIPEMKKFKNQEILSTSDMYNKARYTSLAELYGDIVLSDSVVLKSPYITFSGMHCHQPAGRLGRKFFEMYEVTLDQKNKLIKMKSY